MILESLAEGATWDEFLASYPSLGLNHNHCRRSLRRRIGARGASSADPGNVKLKLDEISPRNWPQIFAPWVTMPTPFPTKDSGALQQTWQLCMLPLLLIGSFRRSTRVSPISSATRPTEMLEWSCFDPTPQDGASKDYLFCLRYAVVNAVVLFCLVGPGERSGDARWLA
ncbi:MAG: hypothetical protein ABI693_34800 [Bryobacteraceae bacterium]